MSIKFVHASDLHLDTPFKGLSQWNPDLASKLKSATYDSFSNIIDLCIYEKVDFLLISGDIFDSEVNSLAAQLKFVKILGKLSAYEIKTYIICGNHDNLSSWSKDLSLPPGVHRFGSEQIEKVTHSKDEKLLADIYGLSYSSGYLKENISGQYKRIQPFAPYSIALLHGMADVVGRDERYAPFFVKELAAAPFDYWALGHVHNRMILNVSPPVVYPGNPQGRDFGETGEKGCLIVELDASREPDIKFVPTQAIIFRIIEIDLTGVDEYNLVSELINEKINNLESDYKVSGNILRIVFTGRTSLHSLLSKPGQNEQLTEMLNYGQLEKDKFTWIDSIIFKTQLPIDITELSNRSDFLMGLISEVNDFETNFENLIQVVDELLGELPLGRIPEKFYDFTPEELKSILENAKWKLYEKFLDDN